ncbi:hypothetical protein KEM48_013641 [Puccinia striiformis f. sp. tritici PST-130]|nr:hypothetical protein KEM48_013641 [Puccinia striiformis f. sp. tritici PST-130]
MADLSIAPLTGGHGLPAYHQVISDHPSATKQNVPAVKNAKKRTPKKKSSKKQANPPSELGDGQDDNNDESETVACVVNFKFLYSTEPTTRRNLGSQSPPKNLSSSI